MWIIVVVATIAVVIGGLVLARQTEAVSAESLDPSGPTTSASNASPAADSAGVPPSTAASPAVSNPQDASGRTASPSPPAPARPQDTFGPEAESVFAGLLDVAQRVQVALADGTDISHLVSEARAAAGALRSLRAPETAAAQWDYRLSSIETAIAALSPNATQGRSSNAQSAARDLVTQVDSALSWVRSLR